ncbi:hypothetical protein [Yoonia sediminilitoris]|uniref:Uncharacterized protein n=1 Tax=Yoonia sediminilitoris TaxID=1286148 RepID=A0A2T6K961_9RHOB|nr:hypothetical protein [Yoonia sediminilitoris]PUB11294.1 hypothetical protein C8N45_11467 [Yoonia sediminilitoris]RCW91110.1 hypothetical protein DFP92_11467 [Yoonia sediminilitoris]
MSIALPSISKRGLGGFLGRKSKKISSAHVPSAQKQLEGRDIAKLFSEKGQRPKARPAKLNETEKLDRAALNSLRGALYSKD